MKSPWLQKRYWIQTLKFFLMGGPVLVTYAFIAREGLNAVCSESWPRFWCEAGKVTNIFTIVVLARFFYFLAKAE